MDKNPQRDISTDRIRKVLDEQERYRPASGETPAHLPCKDHDSRLIKLEEKVERHDERLGAGDVGFAELRKDVATLTEKVGELIGVLKWGAFGVLGFVGTTVGGGAIWVIVQSGKAAVP
jgi:hypothetical protein